MIWNNGGKTSLSNYNSTNNNVYYSPALYFGDVVGRATASYLNVLSGTATFNAIICSDSASTYKYSNFCKNRVSDSSQFFFYIRERTSILDHCVFSENNAQTFLSDQISVSYCSFHLNSFSYTSSSSPYRGLYNFVVNTQCHMWNHNDCVKQFSCVSQYFRMNSFISSFSIFLLFF